MRLLYLIFLLPACSSFIVPNPAPTSRALVDHINSVQTSWLAVHNDISDEEMRFKVMDVQFIEPQEDDPVGGEIVPEPLPDTFDSRDQWPNCSSIKMIRNQATCGSCWAFGAAEIISDRICIQSNGSQQPVISVEDILSCCGSSCGYGCKGGYSLEALKFWNSKGAVTGGDYGGSGCQPYSFAPCKKGTTCVEGTTPSCKTTCQKSYQNAVYQKDKHFGTSAYKLVSKSVVAIQTEIYHNGPVEASFKVYKDFYQYESGVYHYVSGDLVGGHAVKIIGWGTEGGEDYWLIANSWGTSFGEKGFFKMRRGTNECQIEGNVVAGVAKLSDHGEKFDDDDGSASPYNFVLCTLMTLLYYLY
uniref:Pept_C1 domain-containing protein n=1 Tax=Caenorhabditis tropicalis TaxID=1561998 RepID=A0A1I7UE39_9PELO